MSITCEEFHRFMSEFLDGELAEEQREFFAGHIERCPPCVKFMGSYETTVELVRRCEHAREEAFAEVPEELVAAILAARSIAVTVDEDPGPTGDEGGER